MFCNNPFSMLTILENGDVYPCCTRWLDKPVGNILANHLMDIWRGARIGDVRSSVLDGSFRHCTRCPYLPGPKGFVTVEGKATFSSRWGRPGSEPWTTDRIGILKLDYDQTCNLVCKGCRTFPSSLWVNRDKIQAIHEALLSSGILSHVGCLYVTGAGDPFASVLYRTLLKDLTLVTKGSCPSVWIHSNGLLFTPRAWEDLGATTEKVSGISVSVDAACDDTYRLNRGGSWSRLLENLRFISALRSTRDIELILYFVVQSNNFHEMPEFVRMAEGFSASRVDFIALQNWGTFTSDEYADRAVHLPGHSLHQSLLGVLRKIREMKVSCEVGPLDQIVDF
jgi:radical SAM protein with 4Fe4S-binding SPASM domain